MQSRPLYNIYYIIYSFFFSSVLFFKEKSTQKKKEMRELFLFWPTVSGELVGVYCRAIFSTKILRWRVGGRGKNDFCGTMAEGSGAELVRGSAGRHPGA